MDEETRSWWVGSVYLRTGSHVYWTVKIKQPFSQLLQVASQKGANIQSPRFQLFQEPGMISQLLCFNWAFFGHLLHHHDHNDHQDHRRQHNYHLPHTTGIILVTLWGCFHSWTLPPCLHHYPPFLTNLTWHSSGIPHPRLSGTTPLYDLVSPATSQPEMVSNSQIGRFSANILK